jgi:hypothetical protein
MDGESRSKFLRRFGRSRKMRASVITAILVSALFIAMPSNLPTAKADFVNHDVGNLDLVALNDWGSMGYPIEYNSVQQIVGYAIAGGAAWAGLMFDQNSYDHVLPGIALADSFDSGQGTTRFTYPDFNVTALDTPISFEINDGTTQKSHASYTQVDSTGSIGVSNDVRIHQTAWTLSGEDWAIIEWKVENILGTDITNVNIGFGAIISGLPGFIGDDIGVGGDEGDDVDSWDAANDTYMVTDDFGAGVVLGFSSALATNPFNHYNSSETVVFGDDASMYAALTSPNGIIGPPGGTGIRAVLSWNGYTIPAGTSSTFAMVISYGTDHANMMQSLLDARSYYDNARVHITEIQDSSSPSQRIEIFNNGGTAKDLSLWELRDNTGGPLTGNWVPDSIIPPGGYRYLTVTGGTLDPEGDVVTLHDMNGDPVDSVSYGQYGLAPDPIDSESVARVLAGDYSSDWTRDPTPTFGSPNDVTPISPTTEVVLNEVFYNPADPADKFVELYYKGAGTFNIAGWDIVADSVYNIPAGSDAQLSTINRYYHLREFEDPGFFSALDISGDNVYLYGSGITPALMDRVGWNSPHTVNRSLTRYPEGNGTALGYEDKTSQAAGWVFDAYSSYTIVLANEDQDKWGDPGYFVDYSLNITNVQGGTDCIDIDVITEPGGWVVELFESDKVTPLVNKEPAPGCPIADSLPDTGPLMPYTPYQIWARVHVPFPPSHGQENTSVFARSSLDSLGSDRALLKTLVNAWVEPDSYISDPPNPTTIYEKSAGSMGFVNETTVNVNATGRGFLQFTGQDVIFAMDSSGSMEWNDNDPDGPCNGPPMNAIPKRVNAAWNYVDNLTGSDRGGYVDFDSMATLMIPLTQLYLELKEHPTNGLWCSDQFGGTVIFSALQISNQHLIDEGDPSHVKVIILLTDAEQITPDDDTMSRIEADYAADNDILIFTIGLNVLTMGPPGGVDLLTYVAKTTGGQYFAAPDASALVGIYAQIMDMVRSIAGLNPAPGADSPLIKYVLDQDIDFVPGSFQLEPATIETDPNPDLVQYNPTNTTLIWNWPGDAIRVFEYWGVNFRITCSVPGMDTPVNLVPDSAVTYVTMESASIRKEFPEVRITCLAPPLEPYITDVMAEPGGLRITWASVIGAEEYRIYGGPTQTTLDLITVLGTVPAPGTSWLDTTALTSYDEFYYVVRAVDKDVMPWEVSITSNTAGFYRAFFKGGVENAFSLPLEPFQPTSLQDVMMNIGANSISWLDANDDWQTYPPTAAPNARMGEGYVVDMAGPDSSYVFSGHPSGMVRYTDEFAWDFASGSLVTATVTGGDVQLSWPALGGGIQYYIYRSNTRAGFAIQAYTVLNGGVPVSSPPYVDIGAASAPGEYYYMIVPYDTVSTERGSSTYSIGVFTAEYSGNHMFGLPVKPTWGTKSADWYVDQIPNALGIVFVEDGVWKAHFKEFPEGVYDTPITHAVGYEVSVYATSRFSYVGW